MCGSTVSLPLDDTNNIKLIKYICGTKCIEISKCKKLTDNDINRFPNMANGQIELSVILFIHTKSNFK